MMQTVQHPAFEDVTREIPEADAAEWEQQGWTLLPAADAAPGDETSE